MAQIQIFVEGGADKNFINQFVLHSYNIPLDENQVELFGGWDKICNDKARNRITNLFYKNTAAKGTNLIIFDADKNITTRRKEIESWEQKYNITFDLFLFPDNENSGDLETLLEKIIHQDNKFIFDCWQSYEACLKQNGSNRKILTPAKKSKIYSYMEVLEEDTKKVKDNYRDFLNQKHWDLNSKDLVPLKTFLDKHFSQIGSKN